MFLRGMSWTLAPYELLALVLLAVSYIVSSRKIKSVAFTRVAKVALLLIIPLTVETARTSVVINEIMAGVRPYNGTVHSGPFWIHFFTLWLNGCLFGVAVLLFGFVRMALKSEKKETSLSQPD